MAAQAPIPRRIRNLSARRIQEREVPESDSSAHLIRRMKVAPYVSLVALLAAH